MEPAAIAIIFNDKGEVLILERMEPQRDWSGYWGFPGGAAHLNEPGYRAAIRETKEETNLNVHSLKYVRRERDFLDVFTSRDFDGNINLSFEHINYAWVSLNKLDNYKLIPGSKVLIEEAIIL
jgi:8-oxo-dGTP pyrophosphatase MutT (NUDIX family)